MISLIQKAGDVRQRHTSSSVTIASQTGHRRGPYRLCLELASGGMATIYLASANAGVGSHRFVALKVIHPHLATDRDFVEMFIDEAEIAARIRHPNVCAVYDFDTTPGQQYIAMEYLAGESLKSIWRRIARSQSIDVDRLSRHVAHTLSQACEGLQAAHELTNIEGDPLNVVHRDVSPGNVFLTYDGVAKLVDFGVASASHKRHRTSTGVVKGKVGYMAPEVARGLKPDRRTDVWGIGVIAWELLTGRRLFHYETDVETLHAVLTEPIAPPSQVRGGICPEIDAVVLRALSRDPAERQATARVLGLELAQLAVHAGRPIGPPDLGEWIEQLFPGGRARHEQIIEVAAQLDAEANAPSSQPAPLASPKVENDEPRTQLRDSHAGSTSGTLSVGAPVGSARIFKPPPVWLGVILLGVGIGLGFITSELMRRHPAAADVPAAHARDAQTMHAATSEPSAQPTPTPTVTAAVAAGSANEIVIRVRLEPPMPAVPETAGAVSSAPP